MKYNKRRTKILELLDINEKMSYTQLAESLDVSQATIRRDLVFLEKEHAIERYWGGAKRTRNVTVRTRSIMDGVITENLRIIGEIAGGMVQDREVIFIGSGLTTLTMIDNITATDITVVTNGICRRMSSSIISSGLSSGIPGRAISLLRSGSSTGLQNIQFRRPVRGI